MKTKDELINRVLLLSSHLDQAVQEGEMAYATIKDIPTETLKEIADYFKQPMKNPRDYAPYYEIVYTVKEDVYIFVRGNELKIKLTYE